MQHLRNDNDHFVRPYAYLYTQDTDATYETETTKRFIHQFKAASSVYALYASSERLLSIEASFIYAFALCTIETQTTI